jgi:hypothetical protein
MAIVENTAKKLVLKSGSTTLSLDGGAEQITLESKVLFWKRAPAHATFKDVAEVKIEQNHDGASGADIYGTMLVMKSGGAWSVPADDRKQADAQVAAIRKFIGMPAGK